jgi:L,D-transpeptidase-like protein
MLSALSAGSLASAVAPGAAAGTIDSRCLTGRVVCIDKTTHMLRWMVEGRTELSMSARFGGNHRTREGTFWIYWKVAKHTSALTGESMPFSMFFSRGEAIHYSPDFAERGYDGTSSGCVNTRDYETTRELYRSTREGDRVLIYRS